jgi:hypothetical protein
VGSWKRRLSDDERPVLLSELLRRHPELAAEAEEITSALLVVDDQELAGEITARLLGFIVVTGDLDCRDADRDGQPGVELSGERPRRSRDGRSASLPPTGAKCPVESSATAESIEYSGGTGELDLMCI